MSLTLLLTWMACGPSEPVLSGISENPAADPRLPAAEYEKPDGVLADVQYLSGKSWASIRGEVSAQLGDVLATRELDMSNSQEVELARGRIWISDGLIYQIRVNLGEPIHRSDALKILGLPPQVDRWGSTHREFRLRWTWGFDRIRMGRIDPSSEDVVWVEVRRWDPKAQANP